MTASKNPMKYPRELGDWTLAAANDFQVLRFEASSEAERYRGMFAFNNFWKSLEIALTSKRGLYDDETLQRFRDVYNAAQKCTTKRDAEGFGYSMGPTMVLRPSVMRLAGVSSGPSEPVQPLPSPAEQRILAMLQQLQHPGPPATPIETPFDAIRSHVGVDQEPAAPQPVTAEQREESRRIALRDLHKSRQAGLTPHASAAYQMEHRVDRNGNPAEQG